MTATRIFLVFSVIVWLPYALYLTFVPSYLSEIAGVAGQTGTGLTEIRAMYGGLQAGIGILCGVALAKPAFERTALTMLYFLTGCLATARAIGLLLDGDPSGYTLGALAFEFTNAAVAYTLAQRLPAESPGNVAAA